MAYTTGKSIGLAQQSNRQSRVIIEKTILFGRCNECSFRCGNAAMRTWQGRDTLVNCYACWIYRPATWRHQGHNNTKEMG